MRQRELLGRWFAAMNASARTRITLANLKYDLGDKERVPFRRLLRVLRMMTRAGIWKTGSDGHTQAEQALDTFLNQASESMFCKGREIKERGNLSLVTDDESFRKFYVRNLNRAIVIDRKTRVPKFEKIRPEEVRDGATVRSFRNFAWVTDSDKLQEQIGPLDQARIPARVRDYLGLVFKKRRQRLIELRYPPDVAKTLPLAAPTVLEGACATVYRSRDGAEGWGNALDLELLCDGAVEAVHHPIAFTSEFTFRDLGPLIDDRVRTEDELAPLFSPPWTDDDATMVETLSKGKKP